MTFFLLSREIMVKCASKFHQLMTNYFLVKRKNVTKLHNAIFDNSLR